MDELTGVAGVVAKWLGIGLGAVATAYAVRRRWSADALATAKNDGERSWIAQAQRDRDECLERERLDAKVIAELRLRNALLTEKNELMSKQNALLKRLLLEQRPDLAKIINSDFGELPDA